MDELPPRRLDPRSALRWLIGAVFIGLVATGITVCAQRQDEDKVTEPVVVVAVPFEPLTLLDFTVVSEVIPPGGQGYVKNGFCLAGEDSRVIEIFIGIEVANQDPSLGKPPIPLQGIADQQGQRETFPFDPGCIAADEFLVFDVPAELEPGTYNLYIHIRVQGPNTMAQDIVERSNTFSVVP